MKNPASKSGERPRHDSRSFACPPPGSRICAFCGATRTIEVGHVDGLAHLVHIQYEPSRTLMRAPRGQISPAKPASREDGVITDPANPKPASQNDEAITDSGLCGPTHGQLEMTSERGKIASDISA